MQRYNTLLSDCSKHFVIVKELRVLQAGCGLFNSQNPERADLFTKPPNLKVTTKRSEMLLRFQI